MSAVKKTEWRVHNVGWMTYEPDYYAEHMPCGWKGPHAQSRRKSATLAKAAHDWCPAKPPRKASA